MATRREFLKNLSILYGMSLTGLSLKVMAEPALFPGALPDKTRFDADIALFNAMAETIIPKTDTLGAADLRAGEFIHLVVNATFEADDLAEFSQGLVGFKDLVQTQFNQDFISLSAEQKMQLLKQLNQAMVEKDPDVDSSQRFFFKQIKGMTLTAVFTSEYGATKLLKYDPIPGRYRGDVPFAEIGRAWSDT